MICFAPSEKDTATERLGERFGHSGDQLCANPGLKAQEDCLCEFVRTQGQKGGKFYTPSCTVRLPTEVIEPYRGRILETLRLGSLRRIDGGMKREIPLRSWEGLDARR